MSANRKASISKRARELAQKDRVRDREQRRAERKVRAEARAASGIVGPEIDDSPREDLNADGDAGASADADAGAEASQPLPDSAG